MADNQPFLPFFVGDFLGATLLWGGEERALYMLMLAYQWSGGGVGLPADAKRLSQVLCYPHDKFMELWPTLKSKFRVQNGALYNERLERHREKTIELSEKRSSAGSEGGKASAAKRAAQARARKAANGGASELPHDEANPQATVEAIVESSLPGSQASSGTTVGDRLNKSEANGIQNPSILSDPIHSDQIRSDPCVNPEQNTHDVGNGNQGEPSAVLPPNGGARGNGGVPVTPYVDSAPYEQAIMTDFPKGPNPPNWTAAVHNAHQLVSNELATWPELVAAVRRYAAYIASGTATVNVAAHNFFDRRKGNYWQQDWKPAATKSQSRQDANIEAGLAFLARSAES